MYRIVKTLVLPANSFFSEVMYLRILINILAKKLLMAELSHVLNNMGGRSREK